jgi:hypothetical protein
MIRFSLLLIAFVIAFAFGHQVQAGQFDETRYCGEPKRDAKGNLVRSAAVVAAFKRQHPCPSTAATTGACIGWAVNHVIPLACGGCDAVSNMQWLPVVIKTGWQDWSVDRFERKIYASNPRVTNTPHCKNEIVKITDPINSN